MSDRMRHPLEFAPDDLDRPFWEAYQRHEFLLQRSRVTGPVPLAGGL